MVFFREPDLASQVYSPGYFKSIAPDLLETENSQAGIIYHTDL
jgi:hypothetical protein